jgi:curli biogenesis system outer membrane secretion channel CsgG
MKLVPTLLALALAAAALPVATLAGADAKIHIAVAPFATSAVGQYPSQAIESAITDALVNGGQYDVVARAQLDKVLAEQSFNNSQLVDPKAAQKVGRLLGAKFIVVGSLLSVGFQPGFFAKDKFETKAQIQLIDTETGSIKMSDTFVGTESRLGMTRDPGTNNIALAAATKCFENNVKSIAQQFVDRINLLNPLGGYIVAIDGERVAINLGEASGVKVGQEFMVYSEGSSIKDPVTGEALSIQKKNLARLLVTSVEPKLSWTTVVATHSPTADTQVAGETMDLMPAMGLLQPAMAVTQADSRAPVIRKELEKARKKRKN